MRAGSKNFLWVIATVAIAMAPQLQRMTLPVLLMSVLPLGWRLGAELLGWKPLRSLLRYGATVLSLLALVMSSGGLFGRRTSVSLLAAMLALKLLECRSIRDARLVVSFSFFLCATQFLFAQGIFMFVYGVAAASAGLVALAQLQREEAFRPVGEAPALKISMFADLAFSLRLLLLALPIAIAFFLFFPRWASPLWGSPEASLDAKSGLSDSMSPGTIQSLFMDDSPAFRVEFDGQMPEPFELYWRGPVLWQYRDNTWTGSFYGRNVAAESLPPAGSALWRYSVQLEPNERHWLFALDYPVAAPAESSISMDFQILRRQPVTQLLQYRVTSNPNHVDAPELKLTLRSMALELPQGQNPRTRDMMVRWRSETPDDLELIQRVLEYFHREDFHYALDAPLLGRNAVDEFLFASRIGYCEHYASAFAVMMRMAGIPSRIVTGYLGGWYSDLGKYLLVRQSDAHAWTEVWLPVRGWTRIDPTAAVSPLRVQRGSLEALAGARHIFDYPWLRGVRNGLDLVQHRWNDWVIEFNAQSQARLFTVFGLDDLGPAKLVVVLFGCLAVLAALLLPLVFKAAGPAGVDPVGKSWRTFLRRLRQAGFTCRKSDGARELAAAAADYLPDNAPEITQIADLYNRYRYSRQGPPVAEIQQAVKRFRPAKKANVVR
jgi:transglutaminase-like putative cysteine protease